LDALDGGGTMDVPCGTGTACCRSSQFVEVAPDEDRAQAAIPPALLVPSPTAAGHLVLGYDERGRCPMLGDDGCTIYPDRPRACRRYDCRGFAATGLYPAADGPQAAVGARARRWRFRRSGPDDIDALVEALGARLRREPASR
jgi:hypothetical protein